MNTLKQAAAIMFFIVALAARPSLADPPPGYELKFSQVPQLGIVYKDDNRPPGGPRNPGEGTYYGHDELSTLYRVPDPPPVEPPPVPPPPAPPTIYACAGGLGDRCTMIDDFADKSDKAVVHVKWWGSYLNNYINPDQKVDKFLIAFEDDFPGAAPFSRPYNNPIQWEIVDRTALLGPPAAGKFTEKNLNIPGAPEEIYEYNAELKVPFAEQKNTVYWLKIAALIDGAVVRLPTGEPAPLLNTQWGWHNRDYTVKDPLASTVADGVAPGEHNPLGGNPWDWEGDNGLLPNMTDPDDKTIWHFQDDAVTAGAELKVNPTDPTLPIDPTTEIRFQLFQDSHIPTTYVEPLQYNAAQKYAADGPIGIRFFSKDLAFQLFAVPEATTIVLALLGGVSLLCARRQRGNG